MLRGFRGFGWALGILGFALAALALAPGRARAELPSARPEALGFDADRLKRIDAALDRAIEKEVVPGAVALVGRKNRVVYVRAVGRRAVEPASEPMTRDTVFDMASLTKPVATATSMMILLEQGKLRLTDRLAKLMPEYDNHGKGAITVDQLMRHRGGLVPDNPIADYEHGPEAAWKRMAELDLVGTPGDRFRYSDVSFMTVGRLVEKISGEPLDRFAQKHVFDELGMKDTHFRRTDEKEAANAKVPVERVAPTEPESKGGAMLRGAVHDPRARALGGVAGHAGLFSTADDLAIFAATLLEGGISPVTGHRVLSPMAVRAMIDPGSTPPNERRGLGWDVQTNQSSTRGALFGPTSFGHTGFTGTSIWIDPETETFVILLTSRLHPGGGRSSPISLRYEVASLAASAIVDAVPGPVSPPHAGRRRNWPGFKSGPLPAAALKAAMNAPVFSEAASLTTASSTMASSSSSTVVAGPAAAPKAVQCGIDVLVAEGFRPLRHKRVGLVTNHTGRTRGGASTIDVLFRAPNVQLVKLFSPEHGIRGAVDAEVGDSTDEATGLPIVSLYKKDHRKPRPEDLEGIDVLVYDIQDVGARFYTYITTLGMVIEAAKENGKPVVVLDRPNPIGGLAVSGPLRDDEFASFIAYHALPVRHGMTIGELARLYNGERHIGADLEVVRCRGWSRAELFDQTGLSWTNPSPNMRSLVEALLYPGVGMLEATNLATGRGTDTPFERVGAPWIDAAAFAAALNGARVPGARFVPIHFVPEERQYAGTRCGGVFIAIEDWSRFDPLRLGVALAVELRALYPDQWKPEGMLRLMANRATYQRILDGKSVDAILESWGPGLEAFRAARERYLIYR